LPDRGVRRPYRAAALRGVNGPSVGWASELHAGRDHAVGILLSKFEPCREAAADACAVVRLNVSYKGVGTEPTGFLLGGSNETPPARRSRRCSTPPSSAVWLLANVARLSTAPRGAGRQREVKALAPAEAKKLLAVLDGQQPFHCIVVLGLTTGLRPQELLGLDWGAVDLKGGVLSVRSCRSRREIGPSLADHGQCRQSSPAHS
jgi:hypothetical protein